MISGNRDGRRKGVGREVLKAGKNKGIQLSQSDVKDNNDRRIPCKHPEMFFTESQIIHTRKFEESLLITVCIGSDSIRLVGLQFPFFS